MKFLDHSRNTLPNASTNDDEYLDQLNAYLRSHPGCPDLASPITWSLLSTDLALLFDQLKGIQTETDPLKELYLNTLKSLFQVARNLMAGNKDHQGFAR